MPRRKRHPYLRTCVSSRIPTRHSPRFISCHEFQTRKHKTETPPRRTARTLSLSRLRHHRDKPRCHLTTRPTRPGNSSNRDGPETPSPGPPALRRRYSRRHGRPVAGSRRLAQHPRRQPAQHPTDDRRHPEQPQLPIYAQPPTNSAGPVLRAGFTDVFVTGMRDRGGSASAPARSRAARSRAGAPGAVDPMMISRKKNVMHHFGHEAGAQAVLARAEFAVAVGGEAARLEARLAGGDEHTARTPRAMAPSTWAMM